MPGKAGFRETIDRDARRDPDGMAKAKLLCVVLSNYVSLI